MSNKTSNLLLISAIILIVVLTLYYYPNAEFAGADGLAEDYITQSQPNYKPWFSNIWEPPSGEIESLLFSLQAAIGTGVVAYVIGYYKGKKKALK
ncbi:energy-coupling factor ABC transporter substrate-binding protein [Ancylomarina euxinus]|uniref:Cobalt transport protein CbiN n=1 Tax=Ancylomarina euxinus TaxID=2283627 RepID=A0A425XYS8_9BACT|nr:energy-coupling factor ABC transporter substrate-binding protein [Ancylomarina euxinus]MCZ4695764.1 energy-coupling factor ABC transporter substrate-binding protein [Ancylomarina euxinus]MUP16217.1 energy-coupling factor ABC transporter substrate-binding protein [Ancylomarina euxinus]RRG20097.1 energy-coupling factor ABC transporter substrate-binding protein [Ancylomarina euxinus]